MCTSLRHARLRAHSPPLTMNPKYASQIQEEINKLIDCGFIYEIEHPTWVSPIVVLPKKNRKLRVCIDLKKVNASTCRDHYPLPFSKHVLERVDGYSGYNQISTVEEDQPKIAFITEYGVFAFKRMPFGLTNAPITFHRFMNHAFREYLQQFLEFFLNDLCVHSSWKKHLSYLQKVFEWCRYYCISLNPHKCLFRVKHGVILDHIVSRNSISTDKGKVKLFLEHPPRINYKKEFSTLWDMSHTIVALS